MTMFEQALLDDVTNNIVYSAATFSSRSEVYHANHYQRNAVQLQHLSEFARTYRDQWTPTPMRIEEAWFLWRIICTYADFAQLQTSNLYTEYSTHGKRRDLESMCEDLWIQICSRQNKWVMHQCLVRGCAEGYGTVDGNEKLRRPICAAPKLKVRMRHDLPVIVQCCTNYPLLGGKYQLPSWYCAQHVEDTDSVSENDIPEFQLITQHFSGSLTANDDDSLLLGCKRPEKRTKYYHTTAGMLALIRPCGIVISICEMFTCESATQVYLFLLRTFVHDMSTLF